MTSTDDPGRNITPVAAVYDPDAVSEQPVLLPSASAVPLAMPNVIFQPPLSRRGTGPGLVVVRASKLSLRPHAKLGLRTPLDPDPVQKWAEEGFAVVGVQLSGDTDVTEALCVALAGLEESSKVDDTSRFGVLGEYCGDSTLQGVVSRRADFSV